MNKLAIIVILFLAWPALAADAPKPPAVPDACPEARDEWQIRYQMAQEGLSRRESDFAALVVQNDRLKKQVDALKKDLDAATAKK